LLSRHVEKRIDVGFRRIPEIFEFGQRIPIEGKGELPRISADVLFIQGRIHDAAGPIQCHRDHQLYERESDIDGCPDLQQGVQDVLE